MRRRTLVTELLLLSNSTSPGLGFLEHALDAIAGVLPPGRPRLFFVPFASGDPDRYTEVLAAALAPLAVQLTAAHQCSDPVAAIDRADAVFVGGGNSFRLLRALQQGGLRTEIAARVRAGLPYLGASAGTNMACPTLRTTNDMPIVAPDSFEALGLIPFQVNPHYLDPDPASAHQGETRQQRIEEFLDENDVPVLGLREGSWLRVRDGAAAIGGTAGARLFARGAEPRELPPGSDVSALLATRAAVRRRPRLAGQGAGAPGAGAAVQR
jgi:dipeptidase E